MEFNPIQLVQVIPLLQRIQMLTGGQVIHLCSVFCTYGSPIFSNNVALYSHRCAKKAGDGLSGSGTWEIRKVTKEHSQGIIIPISAACKKKQSRQGGKSIFSNESYLSFLYMNVTHFTDNEE